MASSSPVSLHRELPLFPLTEVVLFPTANLPLHIFEHRYLEMINTLLRSDRTFGVLRVDPRTGEMAKVGCATKISEVVLLPERRMNILTTGFQRFGVVNHVNEKPYIIAEVESFEDEEPDRDLSGLCEDAIRLIKEVARLAAKLSDHTVKLPDNFSANPTHLSFWIASQFYADSVEQQSLLELVDTTVRLEREVEWLNATLKELAARSALKDALG